MRISIVGLPGSGKTMLAEKVSEKLSIPHIQLDRFWFEAGGQEVWRKNDGPAKERVRAMVRERVMGAIAGDSWVSDGFYSRYQSNIAERANTVVFLDIPLWRRMCNHGRRMFSRSSRHKEVSFWNDMIFFYDIVRKTIKNGPRLRVLIEKHKDKVTVLHSRREINYFLSTLQHSNNL